MAVEDEERVRQTDPAPPPLDDHEILIKTYDRVADLTHALRMLGEKFDAFDLERAEDRTRDGTAQKRLARIVMNTDLLRQSVQGFRERLSRVEARLVRLEKQIAHENGPGPTDEP